ncbi:hypothetical protein ACFPYJ_01550 [Paenibacillus solisilvae]|uniref:Uncharacterized protein n=1 Tax=Paenibacillus solisilvae TaxID=2486751 RepID=A0ABW0VSG3_9BACL
MKKVIRTDADLDNCIYFQSNIEVSIGGELDDMGVLQDYSEETIKVNGYYYLRCNCTLTTAK